MTHDHALGYKIPYKSVIMEHNLHEDAEVPRYPRAHGLEVFYQRVSRL
jgi:hypothetical protein